MFQVVEGTAGDLPEVTAFLERLAHLEEDPEPAVRDLFRPDRDLFVSRAPGRLDVMGGIADYCGSLVLELPLRESTLAAVQRQPAREVKVVSLGQQGTPTRCVSLNLQDLESNGRPVSYSEGRAFFARKPEDAWAAYVAGSYLVLMRELGARFVEGASILIQSHVPEGKGVSSSAALEVASLAALAAAYEIPLAPEKTALLCQKVENRVVGAPCGVMDQMTAVLGRKDRLLALLCQPAKVQGQVEIPAHLRFWGLDSGKAHRVSGSDYRIVRTAAFMGYRIIASQAGLKVKRGKPGEPVRIQDPLWKGYLANLSPSRFEQQFRRALPEQTSGAEFLESYGETTDSVCRIQPEEHYPVRVATAHPIYEHFRVRLFARLLREPFGEEDLQLLGELMYQSHASYSQCGLGSEGTDRLVALARQLGSRHGIYGAKITGGGSGGTVAVLSRAEAGESIQRLASLYQEATGQAPDLFQGSSEGAAAFGLLRLRRKGSAGCRPGPVKGN